MAHAGSADGHYAARGCDAARDELGDELDHAIAAERERQDALDAATQGDES